MGGMLAARFASLYPDVVERLVLYNPIGLVDTRFERRIDSVDDAYRRALMATYQTVRTSLMRYVAHNPAACSQSGAPAKQQTPTAPAQHSYAGRRRNKEDIKLLRNCDTRRCQFNCGRHFGVVVQASRQSI